jgi:imidazolonepropionase-like amidohydrolase
VNTTIIEGEIYFKERDAFEIDGTSTLKTKLDPFTYRADEPILPHSDSYAIIHATVYPVSGPVIQDGTVVLKDGKISAVGQNLAVPADSQVVNAHGLRVYPGFIDAGTTLGLTEFGQVGQATDAREFGTFEPDLVALTAVHAQSEHFPTTRDNGVLTALTAPRGGAIGGQASILNTAGWTNELMGVKPKAGLCLNWPGGGFANFDGDTDDDDGDQDMGAAAQGFGGGSSATADDISDYFDKAAKYGKSHQTVDLGLEAMQPYLNGTATVFVRARNAAAIRDAVAFIKKYKLKAVLVDAPDAWREAKLIQENNIPVIISPAGKSTLGANTTTNDWDPYDTPYAVPELLKRAGIKFCFQSDGYATSMNLPQRVGESCAYGLSQSDALRSITLTAAEILGIQDRLGSIDAGKMGNLVITDGDPFEMTSNIRYVFINGQPVDLASKFTKLRDLYLQRLK